MGNQLAAAVTVNVTNVSPSFELVAPLGVQHGSFFRSFRCERTIDAPTPADLVRYRRRHFSTKIHTNTFQPAGGADVVVKVFVRVLEDAAQKLLVEHCYGHLLNLHQRIARSKKTTTTAAAVESGPCNLLFYSAVEVQNDRFCMLQRSFVAFSLAERLATRPYWNYEVRLFAGYQLLRALVQLHERWGTVHGDLKTDNVLVDTAGWIYVTDLSPFKPARLPANNPALFDYYYDTSETRICFLDPDKFDDQPLPFSVDNVNTTGHTQAMDIFSAACVFAHIFAEEPLFRLSEVLGLRAMAAQSDREAYVRALLADRGVPRALYRMLLVMLCTPAAERPSARQLLECFTPSVFPRYFAFLYGDVLAPLLARPPDHQAQLLCARLDDVLEEVSRCEAQGKSLSAQSTPSDHGGNDSGSFQGQEDSADSEGKDPENSAQRTAVLVLLPLVLHAVLHASTTDGICRAVCVLQRVLPHCPVDVQTDAVLPHALHCIRGRHFPVVARLLALRVLSSICASAAAFASSNATLFEDLVLPCVEDLISSSHNYTNNNHAHFNTNTHTNNNTNNSGGSPKSSGGSPLLCEVAARLPALLRLARAHLERRQVAAVGPFGAQLSALLERGWEAVSALLTHSDAAVAVAALRSAPEAAAFFGEERTQEDLIPLLTTLVASAIDVQRELHAQAVASLAVLQAPRMQTLQFFVNEGLRHADTAVVQRTVDALTNIVLCQHVAVENIMPLVHRALPHVLSANAWVRASALHLIEATARTHRASDVWAYLGCALRPLLRRPVPLANITQYAVAIKRETEDDSSAVGAVGSRSVRVLGGDTKARALIVGCASSGHAPHYAVPNYVSRRTLQGLVARVPSVDVTFDPVMLPRPMEVDKYSPNANKRTIEGGPAKVDVPWRLFFLPTLREKERLCMREKDAASIKNGDHTTVKDKSCKTESDYSDALHRYGRDALSCDAGSLPVSMSWTGDSALDPVAAPWFSRTAHRGGIYCAASSSDGTLVTAGACGEAMLWSLSAGGLDYAHRVNCGAAATSTLLFAGFLREGSAALLCLGGTDGVLSVHDAARDVTVSRRVFDGTALRAAAALSAGVSLVASAGGGLFAVDHRCAPGARDVWRAALPAAHGAPVGLVALPAAEPCGAAVAGTAGAALFDLRSQLLLRAVPAAGVRCAAAHPAAPRQALLGTADGAVRRVDFAEGGTDVAMQTAAKAATRAILALPAMRCVITAGDDRHIRRWDVAAPAQSRTLVCPPYVSPPYVGTDKTYIAEVQGQKSQDGQTAPGLARGNIPRQHEDAILALCVANCGGTPRLVSGARDGTLSVWHNNN